MNILSAGAAKGLLQTIAATEGLSLDGEFGAVGAIRDRLNAGAKCDVIVLTAAMIEELAATGQVDASTVVTLGAVRTGVALPVSKQTLQIDNIESLRALCAGASQIYFPDPVRATAGIHCLRVLTALGLAESHKDRFAAYPNGATAMRAMADSGDADAIGITQCSEILYTPGVRYAGALPSPFELATAYSAAIVSRVENVDDATQLLRALSSATNEQVRVAAGFEPPACAVDPRGNSAGTIRH